MPTDFDSPGPDTATNPSITRSSLLAELEAYEHLLFEPMTQVELQRLYALYADWQQRLGDSPDAIPLCDALDEFIEANLEAGPSLEVEQAYLDLVQLIQASHL